MPLQKDYLNFRSRTALIARLENTLDIDVTSMLLNATSLEHIWSILITTSANGIYGAGGSDAFPDARVNGSSPEVLSDEMS